MADDRRSLPSRATRGKRMHSLIGEEAEADESFWGQGAWEDAQNDEEYHDEGDVEDEFDADFYDPEDEEIDDENEEKQTRKSEKQAAKKRRTGKYKDPALKKTAKQPRTMEQGTADMEVAAAAIAEGAEAKTKSKSAKDLSAAKAAIVQTDRSLRRSTSERTREAEIRRKQVDEEKKFRQANAKPKIIEPILTQEEMLEEASRTEIFNKASLEQLLKLEEEKKRIDRKKTSFTGPLIRFHSKAGRNLVTFTETSQFPPPFNQPPIIPPKRSVCPITGLPAKYFDPLSKQPYANRDAFSMLRQFYQESLRAQPT